MDVLDDILGSLRLTGGVVIDGEGRGDWCLHSQFTDEDKEDLSPGSALGDIIGYHFVRSGEVRARVGDGAELRAKPGDIILLPRNDSHLFYTSLDSDQVDSHDVIQHPRPGQPARIHIGEGGAETSFYCGFLAVSADHHPLLDSLPPILKLSTADDARSEWLESSLRIMNEGTDSPELLARMAELFFAEAVRRYVEQLPSGKGGWLAGLRDPAVARALSVIHSRYAEELDVEMLAREAGISRSVLGERFVELIGEPPMRYCARWRMRMAANMLRDRKQKTANIAYAVGFSSEAAFNRAFKREYGEPPATWRRKIEAEELARATAAEHHELPPQQVRYCTASDGTRLAYSVTGEGPPLVKTANWLNHIEHDWHSPLWDHWLHEFTRGHSLIRYDERGNGLSDWDTPELSLDAFVDDLASVVRCLELETFDLLAISQGAAVAVAYAVRHPERVRRLVICNGYAAGWAVRADPAELARREAMLTLTEVGWGADNPTYRQLFTSHYIPEATPRQMGWFNEMQRLSASPENAVRLQRTLGAMDVRKLLPRVRTPTLIFHSRNDQAVPFSQGEELAAGIPGAQFIPLESRNHILVGSEPAWDVFAKVSRDFLGSEEWGAPVTAREPPKDEIHQCTAADGTRLAYATTGEGFPLVKAASWMSHLEVDPVSPAHGHWVAECARNNRFIRSDMRGFGLSEWEPPNLDFEHMVEDLATVIDDAGVERCDLLGLTHGGTIAMAYAARHPERVRKLVLVNAFAAGWRVRADPEEIGWRESLLEMNRNRPAFRRSLLGEMFITLYYPSASQALIDWHNENFQKLGPAKNMEPVIDLVSRIDIRDELAKIRAPALFFHSRLDGNVPLVAGRQAAEGIADARFVELDSVNHFVLEDEPAWPVITREMRAFLSAD